MKNVIVTLFASVLIFMSSASLASEKGKGDINITTTGSVVVEGLRGLFPKRSEKALDLVPYSLLDELNDQISVEVDGVNQDIPTHTYYKNKEHLKPENTPKNPVLLLDALTDVLAKYGVKAVAFAVLIWYMSTWYIAGQLLNSPLPKDQDDGAKLKKRSWLKAISLFSVLLYLSPKVIEVGTFTVVPFVVIFVVCFVGSLLFNNVGLAMLSLIPEGVDDSAYEHDKESNLFELHVSIDEIASSKIIHDALLDTSIKEQQFKGGKGIVPASNQALMDIGQAQLDLESSRFARVRSRQDCLLLDNWSQAAFLNIECAWVLEPATNHGIIESYLKPMYQRPTSYDDLSKSEKYIHSKIFTLINKEIANYTAHRKAEICVGVHSANPHIFELQNSVFCAQRNDANHIVEGEFYGYESIGGGYYSPVSGFDTPDDMYDFSSFDKELGDLITGLYKHFAQDELEVVQEAMSEQYNKGMFTAAPSLSSINSRKINESSEAFDRSVKRVNDYLSDGVYPHILTQHSMHSRQLDGFKGDADMVDDYLLRHFPYARSVWFGDFSGSSSFDFMAGLVGFVPVANGSDVAGTIVETATKVMGLGVMLLTAEFIYEQVYGNSPLFVGTAGTGLLLMAFILSAAYIFLFFGFLFKFVLEHMVFRVCVTPLLFVVAVVKGLVEDLVKGREAIHDDDFVGAGFIKAEIMNPFIKLSAGVISWLLGFIMLIPVVSVAQKMIEIMPWFIDQGFFTVLVLNVVILPIAFSVIGYLMCYRMPFTLYNYITADIDDPLGNLNEDGDTIVGIYNKSKIQNIVK